MIDKDRGNAMENSRRALRGGGGGGLAGETVLQLESGAVATARRTSLEAARRRTGPREPSRSRTSRSASPSA